MSRSIVGIGLQGMLNGMTRLAEDAAKVLDSTTKGDDTGMVEGFINMKRDAHQIKASQKVIKTGQELQDNILDILA